MEFVDLLLINASQLLTLDPTLTQLDEPGPDAEAETLGVVQNGAVAIRKGEVVAVGQTAELRAKYQPGELIDAGQRIVTPGLVDAHTHLIFAGSRHLEFGLRMRGASYREILAAGGGIHSTVQATRQASLASLVEEAEERLATALAFGVTTVEVKSGYGLTLDTELKMLECAKQLNQRQPVRIVPTFLGAHVVPAEYKTRRNEYVDLVVKEMIPQVVDRSLATSCDVFLDDGAFSLEEAEAILTAARDCGLGVRAHAGQFSDQGGAELLAGLGGLSADHLEWISDRGIAAMAQAGVVANLLPGAAFSLRDNFPDGRRLLDGGVQVAVSTDNNPGTSRTENLPLMATMAVTRMGLTCAEAWLAITRTAALALGLGKEVGSLVPGCRGDLVIFDVGDFRAFLYHFGVNPARTVVVGGKVVW